MVKKRHPAHANDNRAQNGRRVVNDLAHPLPVTESELAFFETYFDDLITQAANDNFAEEGEKPSPLRKP